MPDKPPILDETKVLGKVRRVRFDAEGANFVDSRDVEAERLVLARDGNGPFGFYDRVHLFTRDGRHHIFNAHMARSIEMEPEN